ncbi:ABC transporter permease [Halalkalibacterium halodurans]|uniref:BH0450 protein n=2 Tax=Halalkalibacterium halodurans TaxID=86665 RepID=Q9KFM9_HALH5|nr:ABC transporter permease [Halalkalibacterium halodurans]MED4082503.1 ABC transporter permease [Halalkalibacterium halodurans]MED4085748.1 ABC transporter permease [Halalkalibacterium halodurans]MED4105614.1 ABC transporter permease [Halalkalibacterium halodurans]MED4107513.1 ABC transporter permease [Halalkalibacterium halodurans]MED4122806.1 ABC transporter permease [Halalkalibacterium halodurans]
MSLFRQSFMAEWMKIRKSTIWLVILGLVALPVFYGCIIFTQIVVKQYNYTDSDPWLMQLMMVQMFYGTIFLPIIVSIIIETVLNFERKANEWEHLFLFPIKRNTFYLSKMAWVFILTALAQLLMFTMVVIAGIVIKIDTTIPVLSYLSVFILGTIGAISLGSLLFYLFMLIKSSRVALAISIFLSFPAFLALSNESGSWLPSLYPWALPIYGMTQSMSSVSSLLVFLGVCFILIILSSFLTIKRLKNGALSG